MTKNVQTTTPLHSFHMLARLWLQQYVNQELLDVLAGFRKGRGGTRNQIANIHWSYRKQRNSRKTSISASSTMWKPLTVWRITTNCGKFLKRWEYQMTLLVSWETCMQVKKQQLETDMEQQTGSKLGKEYSPCLLKIIYGAHHMKCWAGWITSWN